MLKTFKTRFATFYSYKGGVGRTSSLVNSALLRAISGDRVVVIDFDLEAPGLWSYVREIADQKNIKIDFDNRSGILEYLSSLVKGEPASLLRNNAISNEDLGLKIDGKIWFVGAGNTSDPNYTKNLSSLNWSDIFEKNHGELILENLKRQISSEFEGPDYVFIDSRTGITEVGGVCTRYLADLVVTLASLNDQNILGTSKIVGSFKKANIPTILVASNVPVGLPWGEKQLFSDRIAFFKKHFNSKPDLLIYHYPSLSLKESLPALFKIAKEDAILKEDPLLKSYENLSDRIHAGNPHNFEKFLRQNVVNYLYVFDEKKEATLQEAFAFFEKNYANRQQLLNLLKSMVVAIKNLTHKAPEILLTKSSVSALEEIKKHKAKNFIPEVGMLRQVTLDRSSNEIVSYLDENRKILKNADKHWYSILSRGEKLRATELLNEVGEWQFVYDTTEHQATAFYALAKAYAAEKLGLSEESLHFYKKAYIDAIDSLSDVESPGVAFAYAYAAKKVDDLDAAAAFVRRAGALVAFNDDESSYFFIPTTFARTTDRNEFTEALEKFRDENL